MGSNQSAPAASASRPGNASNYADDTAVKPRASGSSTQQQYEQRPLRQQLQQPNSKQRRSAKRSAEHHARVRALRAVGLVGCFVVRLQAALALRRAASPTQGPEAWEMEAIVDLAKSKDKEGLRLFSEQLGITPGAREVAADALAAW